MVTNTIDTYQIAKQKNTINDSISDRIRHTSTTLECIGTDLHTYT